MMEIPSANWSSSSGVYKISSSSIRSLDGGTARYCSTLVLLARDVGLIYTSRAYVMMSVSVCLSVCPSVCDGSALAHYS